jgi:branched-chain amino acid transport system substrate-binding protein
MTGSERRRSPEPRRTRSIRAAIAMALAGTLASCSTDPVAVDQISTTTVATPTTSIPERVSDGVLRLGTLLPLTGPGAAFGVPLADAVRRAVAIVNEAGGVNGVPIEVTERDEGADASTALAGANALINDDRVDAIIGPASSRVALSVLGQIVRQGVLSCSPVATAISLSSFPDQGLFMRTQPSDALQAEVIARLVDQTGRSTTNLLYPDDMFGRDFSDAVRQAASTLGITIEAAVSYDPTADELDDAALAALEGSPPVVVVLGDAEAGLRMLSAAVAVAPSPAPVFIVNDALRGPLPVDLVEQMSAEQLSRIRGVSPAVLANNADLLALLGAAERDPATAFASAAVDCVNLIALGAASVGSDDPSGIASQVSALSRGGTSCRDFPTCMALLGEGRNIDYNGYEGLMRLDASGDVTVGAYERFSFDAEGNDITDLRLTVGAAG